MKPRRSVSFIIFCIMTIFTLGFIVPSAFIRTSETPGWFGATLIFGSFLMILLVPMGVIFGIIYKTEDPKMKTRNKIGLWGNIVFLATIIGIIVYTAFFYDEHGYAMPG